MKVRNKIEELYEGIAKVLIKINLQKKNCHWLTVSSLLNFSIESIVLANLRLFEM